MNTKLLLTTSLAALMLGAATAASAGSIYANTDSGALSPYRRGALPVLIKVDQQGAVTSIAPAYKLKPRYRRLLRKTLDSMITGPAHNKAGHATSSQFVMYLSTQTTPRNDGEYNLRFTYIKAMPVPAGAWYWGHLNGRKLALISADAPLRPRHYHVPRHWQHAYPAYRTFNQAPRNVTPQPSVQSRPMSRPQPTLRNNHR